MLNSPKPTNNHASAGNHANAGGAEPTQDQPVRLELASPERRNFMRVLLISAGAGLVTACAPRTVPGPQPVAIESTPNIVLPSPQPPLPTDGTPTPNDGLLASFLALSVLLTGMDEAANPTLGRTYLQALQANPELEMPIAEFIQKAGFADGEAPQDLDALHATGVLDNEASSAVANRIVNNWYSGTYTNADGDQTVATFVDSLAWKSLVITKPLTICAQFGAWARPPEGAPAILPMPTHLDALKADG